MRFDVYVGQIGCSAGPNDQDDRNWRRKTEKPRTRLTAPEVGFLVKDDRAASEGRSGISVRDQEHRGQKPNIR
jgi:hypothetical protein